MLGEQSIGSRIDAALFAKDESIELGKSRNGPCGPRRSVRFLKELAHKAQGQPSQTRMGFWPTKSAFQGELKVSWQ